MSFPLFFLPAGLVFTFHVSSRNGFTNFLSLPVALPSHVDWTRGRWSFPGRGGGTTDTRGTTDIRLPVAAREARGS